MPDISMCQNKKCSRKDTCYRFLATPNVRQSYALFNEKTCLSYVPLIKKEEKK